MLWAKLGLNQVEVLQDGVIEEICAFIRVAHGQSPGVIPSHMSAE
jgi:hypothetical protein